MDQTVTKSRNLPLIDFFDVLQKEYLSYYVRSKIYILPYSEKYKKYCICKKEKIDKISETHNLPSIFNSESSKKRYLTEFFNDYGLPNFEYRDEESKTIMGRWDFIYWFKDGSLIKVKSENEGYLAVVLKNIYMEETVIIEHNKSSVRLPYSYISRIVEDSIIDF